MMKAEGQDVISVLFVQNEGKGSGDCVEGLAAGLSGGFLPDAPDSFLVDFFLPVVFGWFPGTGKGAVPDGAFL